MPDFLTATIWQVGGGSGSSSLYRQFQSAAGRQIHTPAAAFVLLCAGFA